MITTDEQNNPPKLLLRPGTHGKYTHLFSEAHAYPKNKTDVFIIMPTETRESRYLEIRKWYPSRWFKGMYQPAWGVEIVAPETCTWMINILTKYQNWIEKGPRLKNFVYPTHEIPFDIADDLTCERALAYVFGENGEHLSKFRGLLAAQNKRIREIGEKNEAPSS